MKFFLVAFISALICAATVNAGIFDGGDTLQKTISCINDVFGQQSQEHKELGKYYSEFKKYALDSNLQLEECKKIEQADKRDECVDDVAETFAYKQLGELITRLEEENKELSIKIMDSFVENCD